MENVHTTVAIYKNHEAAIKAIEALKEEGFNEDYLSIAGKSEEAEEQAEQQGEMAHVMQILQKSVPTGGILGGFLSAFAGLGLASIPGLGVLFVGGAMAGAIGGLSMGLAGSGALSSSGINEEGLARYEEELKNGNFLLMFHHQDEARVYEAKEKMKTETDMEEAQVHLNENLAPKA